MRGGRDRLEGVQIVSLLNYVRETCKAVAEQAATVQIDVERIGGYADKLPLDRVERAGHDPDSHYLGHREDTVAFFLTLDAINFGSGYFPHLDKRPGMSGYFTVASALTNHFRAHGALSASELAQLSVQECTRMMGQDPDNAPVRELMGLFGQALNDLGQFLLDRFQGSFTRLVEAARGSAERLVGLLIEMPLFRDVTSCRGTSVCFYKRAQLAAADLSLAFEGRGPGCFHDLDRLTIFADNVVPHVLRVDGILRYEDDLLARINREELIPAGSTEEVEIRACAVHAAELLRAKLHRAGQEITSMQLDQLLWNKGRGHTYKSRPRHRTRTVYY
jgi:hypothetical protein